ncbi:hypothetical protein EXIGLDRAFT_758824 [Exidia glandulosa HHB12029]|uniref:F-box domain-containing protein n=1 Tax=Exidia glandulosa HHB12029 TaxID=1314781 RepID=A0A165QE30_EXIGL|nr:hypothetical protein EXIGLDRAFT_758824 [Exidia glandulosa HHB12029]
MPPIPSPPLQRSYDFRARQLLSDPTAAHSQLIWFPPATSGPSVYQPMSLRFLDRIQDFHKRDTRSPFVGRFKYEYDDLYFCLYRMLEDTDCLLRSLYVVLDWRAPGFVVSAHNQYCRTAFYRKWGIYNGYPVQNLVIRLYTLMSTIALYQSPVYQTFTINSLPVELIFEIVNYSSDSSVWALSNTASRYRTICQPRLQARMLFIMRYDADSLRGAEQASTHRSYLDAIEGLMIMSRNRVLHSMRAAEGSPLLCHHARELRIINEWDRLYPLHVPDDRPSILNRLVFNSLYAAICELLVRTARVTHLHLGALGINTSMLQHIASHPTIRRLTLDRCMPLFATDVGLVSGERPHTLMNITYLGLGFGSDTLYHRSLWMVLSLCPQVRALFAYSTSGCGAVRFPDPDTTAHHLQGFHTLEHVHFQGASAFLLNLISWIATAAATSELPSRLSRFKLHAPSGVYNDELMLLVNALGDHHRNLRVLILEGLDVPSPDLVARISARLPRLEALGLFVTATAFLQVQEPDPLGCWRYPTYLYADALAPLEHLRHFEANFYWTPYTFSPRCLDALLAAQRTPAFRLDPQMLDDEDGFILAEDARNLADCMDDGISLVLPFAAKCVNLESFAIRGNAIHFSCSIVRNSGGYELREVRKAKYDRGFEEWNPHWTRTWTAEF